MFCLGLAGPARAWLQDAGAHPSDADGQGVDPVRTRARLRRVDGRGGERLIWTGTGARWSSERGLLRVGGEAAGRVARSARAVEVVLRTGHRLVTSPGTRIAVAGARRLVYRRVAELGPDDFAAVQLRGLELRRRAPFVRDWQARTRQLEPNLALLLGVLTARGSHGGRMLMLRLSDEQVRQRVVELLASLAIGVRLRPSGPGYTPALVFADRDVAAWLTEHGGLVASRFRRIPDLLLAAPHRCLLAFLRGMSLHLRVDRRRDGTPGGIRYETASPLLAEDILTVLTDLGVLASITDSGDTHRVRVDGEEAQMLLELAPPLSPESAGAVDQLLAWSVLRTRRTLDVVPFADGPALYRLLPEGRAGHQSTRSLRKQYGHLLDPRTRHISRGTVKQLADLLEDRLPAALRQVLDQRLHFVPIASARTVTADLSTIAAADGPIWVDGFLVRSP